jgi:glycosyltransferase involved in cell wall biosynthesis
MLCGCIPVVSDVASMPEIISNTGFILREKSSKKLCEVLESIPNNHSVEAQVAARNRIANNFTESARKEQFLKAIREI